MGIYLSTVHWIIQILLGGLLGVILIEVAIRMLVRESPDNEAAAAIYTFFLASIVALLILTMRGGAFSFSTALFSFAISACFYSSLRARQHELFSGVSPVIKSVIARIKGNASAKPSPEFNNEQGKGGHNGEP